MYVEISNSDLQERHIPSIEQDLMDIWEFALSFNGYDFHRTDLSGLSQLCQPVEKYFEKHKNLPYDITLAGLRTCLFFTQRVWRGSGEGELSVVKIAYIDALLKAIRNRVRNEERD